MRWFFLCLALSLQAIVVDVKTTLQNIEEMVLTRKVGAYLCFQEDELERLTGVYGTLWEQIELEKLFSSNEPNILKSFDLPYTALNGHRIEDRWAAPFFHKFKKAWQLSYEPLGERFLSTAHRKECGRFFRFIKSQSPLILTDFEIPQETQKLLFGVNSKVISALDEPSEYGLVIALLCPAAKIFFTPWMERGFLLDLGPLRSAIGNWNIEVWEKWLRPKNEIKILYTSALIPAKFEERKSEYIQSLKKLADFGYKDKVYIAESGPFMPFTFFEEFCDHVFYANTNDLSLVNKGVNEVKATKAALKYFDFDDEDLIVKLTGRYLFENDQFLRLVKNNPEIDAFARLLSGRGVVTGCFALRCKEYKKMLQSLDEEKMEERLIDIEWEVAHYIDQMAKEGKKVMMVDQIGLMANVSNEMIVQW